MGKRPARCFRKPVRAYTRTARRVVTKAYIVGVPDSRIRIFDMGKPGDYDCEVSLVVSEPGRIRDTSLESLRVSVNKFLERQLGSGNYYFKIRVYPHQVLREHAMLTGAGADRLSKGMKKAFGKPVGRAAQVKEGQKIMSIFVPKDKVDIAKKAFKRVMSKVTLRTKILIEEKNN